jgi:protein TonB
MVLSHRHAGQAGEPVRIDPLRVTGMAGAMAVNAMALMLLLVPVQAPPVAVDEKPDPDVIFVKPVEPPPPPPPEVVQVRRQTTAQPTPRPIERPTTPPPPVIVDSGEMSTPMPTNIDVAPVQPSLPPGPEERTALEYSAAPPPPYPRRALNAQIEGTVVLRVLVGADGKPIEVNVHRSSGNRELDDAATRQVLRRWAFRPAMRNGQAIQVYGLVPIRFSLDRD